MPFSEINDESSVYQRLLKWILSGEIAPGTKLAERKIARELGVSRIPVRESIRQMVAQGLLVGGEKWKGVRTRSYTTGGIRQLFEFREVLERGTAEAAAVNATKEDVARMEAICDTFEAEIGKCSWERWAQLEHDFHAALAEASHNERLIHNLKHLLAECHYVFFVRPIRIRSENPAPEQWAAELARAMAAHRAVVEAVRAGNVELVDKIIRDHIGATGRQAARETVTADMAS